jgi:hypothetical protein
MLYAPYSNTQWIHLLDKYKITLKYYNNLN